jgi:peptide chain release factor subunit 1
MTSTIDLAPPETTPAWHVPTPASLERLAGLRTTAPLVVTCYLRLGVEDRIRRRYLLALKEAIRHAELQLEQDALTREEQAAVRRDLARIQECAANTAALPQAPGAVLFASEAIGLFEVMGLPRATRTRLVRDNTPAIAEVVSALEATGPLLVAVVDRTHSRFFEVTAFDATELPCLVGPARRGGKFHSDRADAPGWGEHDYHNRMREERHRELAADARELQRLAAGRPIQGVVLAGPEKTTSELERFLPAELRKRLIGRPRVNPTSVTPAAIRHLALEARAEAERLAERELVANLEGKVGAGWAVDGPSATLRALSRGMLRTLVVRGDLSGAGFRCTGTGRLVIRKSEGHGEGALVPVADLANAAIEEAIRQRIEVVVIDDPEAREEIDGLAGVLRFR